eukprot:Skav228754  [mRNA]  locus=scaffold589:73969:91194:+ [translate_table: standard]
MSFPGSVYPLRRCWSSALLELRDRLRDEDLQKVFQRLEHAALEFTEETWGLSAPMLLVSLVRASTAPGASRAWSPTCNLLVGAIARHTPRMGPMHLEISAYSCSRLSRFAAKNSEASAKIAEAAAVLLEYGTRRVSRFVAGLASSEARNFPRHVQNVCTSLARHCSANFLTGEVRMVDRGPTQAWAPTSNDEPGSKAKAVSMRQDSITGRSSGADPNAIFATNLRDTANPSGNDGRTSLTVAEKTISGRPSVISSDQGSRSADKTGEVVTSPSSSSVLHSFKKSPSTVSKSRSRCKVCWHAVGRQSVQVAMLEAGLLGDSVGACAT